MLTEQRFDIILKLLEERKSITVTELRELLDASESTVRRDITALDKAGKLTKVFGGAVALNHKVTAYEPTVAQKSELNVGISGGCKGCFCHKCSIPCPDSGKDGNPGLPDRRRTEEFYRGSRRQSGDADDPDVSFYKGLLRNQRDHQKRRLYHTGYQ